MRYQLILLLFSIKGRQGTRIARRKINKERLDTLETPNRREVDCAAVLASSLEQEGSRLCDSPLNCI